MFYTQQSVFPINTRVPSLLFVADVQYLFYPEYFSFADRSFRKISYLRSMQQATRITTVSRFTADHLIERCGVPGQKIRVIHHGYDPPADEPDEPVPSPVAPPYIYYPAASYPHKGHVRLFRSFADLKRRGLIRHRLLLSGDRNAYWPRLEKVIREEGMESEIVHMGYVSYDEVVALYRNADAIVFPSEFEGFGLPVLEAVRFRKKIICSRLETFAELGVPACWQIDFSDPDQLLRALAQAGPTSLEQEPISWPEAVRHTLEFVRETAS